MKLTPARAAVAVLLLAAVMLAVFRPWVVKPLDSAGRAVVGPVAFDAEAFVGRVWAEQLPGKLAGAGPATLAGPTPQFLKGQGLVVAVDTASRVGLAQVDLDPADGRADVDLQLGPVVTGSALRDALGLAFADFDTQVDYANVGAALNRRALASAAAAGDASALKGKRITFVGAGLKAAGRARIVPVQLALAP